jgi:hypothetical protein
VSFEFQCCWQVVEKQDYDGVVNGVGRGGEASLLSSSTVDARRCWFLGAYSNNERNELTAGNEKPSKKKIKNPLEQGIFCSLHDYLAFGRPGKCLGRSWKCMLALAMFDIFVRARV